MKKFLATICAATFLLTGCGSNKNAEQPTPVQQTEPTPPVTTNVEPTNQSPTYEDKAKEIIKNINQAQPIVPAKVTNLGMTLEQFKAAYNAKIREISQEVDWDISSLDLIYGQYDDMFEYDFSSEGILFGTVEKDTGLVKEVCVMSSPKDLVESSKMSFAYGVVILTLSPELSREQRRVLWDNLKLTADKIPELELSRGIVVCGNVRYTTQFSAGIFLFTATAKDL